MSEQAEAKVSNEEELRALVKAHPSVKQFQSGLAYLKNSTGIGTERMGEQLVLLGMLLWSEGYKQAIVDCKADYERAWNEQAGLAKEPESTPAKPSPSTESKPEFLTTKGLTKEPTAQVASVPSPAPKTQVKQ
jgi:hypothetical protein